MSERLAASSTSSVPNRGHRDPLIGTRRLTRKQVMTTIRLRVDLAEGNGSAIEGARKATGPLWAPLLALVEYRTDGAVEARRACGAWARIRVGIDLLMEHYAAVDAAARRQAKPAPKPRIAAVPPAPAPQTPRAPFKLGRARL